jgi:hypothetical protein
LDDLRQRADAGDVLAQYQLGRQLLVAGPAAIRQKGLQWIERAAEGGYAEAQYRLVTYYENRAHIMRDNPARGVALLQAAAEQNHLRAMGTLALAWEKGRYGLERNFKQARHWYETLLQAYESGHYLGEVDEPFIQFHRRRLEYVIRAHHYKEDRARRYAQATDLERQIMDIEDRYRRQYENAVNGLNRGNGRQQNQKNYRAQVEQLRQEYIRQRDREIENVKRDAGEKNQSGN